jgi:ribosomal-protein-alanine N-acetyltransferase
MVSIVSRAIDIGPARFDEAQMIASMSRSFVEEGLPWSWTPARVMRAMRDPECEVAVARSNGRIVAFAVMRFALDDAHLLLFGVDPYLQGRGLGRRLLRWLETMVRNMGLPTVFLEVRKKNVGARRFYRALGYVELDVRRGFYSGVEDAVIMASDLLPIRAR